MADRPYYPFKEWRNLYWNICGIGPLSRAYTAIIYLTYRADFGILLFSALNEREGEKHDDTN